MWFNNINKVMNELTIATINTWKGEGDYHNRIELMARQLKAADPDVILCQEAFQTDIVDTLKQLACYAGVNMVYSPARNKMRSFGGNLIESSSGLGILSKYPIEVTTSVSLPADPIDGERLAQYSILRVNDEPLLIINTHLTHLKGFQALRISQLSTILEHPLLNERYLGIFLCGDFNACEEDEELQYLLNYKKFKILNCYKEGKGEIPGHTLAKPKSDTNKCIDFIFFVENQFKNKPQSFHSRLILNTPDEYGIFPSDHFGVMVTCKFKNSRESKIKENEAYFQ
jgi:endonuclease/exonuclease/phosphatase family metal-dependent hydrolase